MSTQAHNILGVEIDKITQEETSARILKWLHEEVGHQIVTINPEFVMAAQKDERFKAVLNQADLRLPDGAGILMAAEFLTKKKTSLHRFTGVDLTWELARLCAREGKSVYLLGARSQEVGEKTKTQLQREFPNLRVVGVKGGVSHPESINPIFEEWTNEDKMGTLINDIKVKEPDVLLVAYGAPQQDLWIADHLNELPSVKIAVGVGGTFDYISKTLPRAPRIMRGLGLEWLYRLMRQPQKRWRRIITAVIYFPVAVIINR